MFVAQGANVVVLHIQETEEKMATERVIAVGGKASFFKTDVSKPEEMHALVELAL